MRVTKATNVEKTYYAVTMNPVHPLFGWLAIGGQVCAVEYLGEGPGNPNYEVLAPAGYRFACEGAHTILGVTLADLYERVAGDMLEKDPDVTA